MIPTRAVRPLLALALAVATVAPAAAETAGLRGVIELFTSQGCSSCPPADRLAAELARERGLIVLSLPVDYWDYLGWKDTLGSPADSARQRAYALARGDRQVYTPQVVVNGLVPVVGSDRAAIVAALRETQTRDGVLSLQVDIDERDGQIDVTVPAGPEAVGEVWLAAVARAPRVTISRGENANREMVYTNVVRRMTRLGVLRGGRAHFCVARDDAVPADADSYVVLVQRGSSSMPGAILGAAVSSRF
jgi:hypothetical protein